MTSEIMNKALLDYLYDKLEADITDNFCFTLEVTASYTIDAE